MNLILILLFLILGVCFGSFVNMLCFRTAVKYGLKKNKFLIEDKKYSYCDGCGRRLAWFENIPIISWVIQKGKTRCCQKRLPLSYPIVEIVMGIAFIVYFLIFVQPNLSDMSFWKYVPGLLIVVFLIFDSLFDLKYMILPDFSTLILIVTTILTHYLLGSFSWEIIITAVISCLFLLILYLITKGKGMGMGDVKLAFVMGLLLGGYRTIVAFYIAFISGAIVGLILILCKKVNRKSVIPFGPFLILGTVIAWWWGEKVINLIKIWI